MRKSFYIIDGHAHIYRAFFAPFRDLSSPTGEPTKATFVFTQMLLNLIEQRKPDYLAMVIDKGGDTDVFRKTIYPDYKANRQSPPDDFKPQEQRILKIVEDAGIPIFGMSGYEADDLIATMASQLCKEDYDIYIVSKDKDIRQLLSDCIKMYDPQSNAVTDIAAMKEKCGYGPDKAIDVQTLMGDAIDNVPGIPGVGEKTAVKLLNDYGSIDGILHNVEKLTPKMRENFKTHGKNLGLSRELVTLIKDVPLEWKPEACKFNGINVDGMNKHLNELNFRALSAKAESMRPRKPSPLAEISGGLFDQHDAAAPAGPQHETSKDADYRMIATGEELDAFVNELKQQPAFAFDTETDSITPTVANLVGLSFSWKEKTGYYIPVRGPVGSSHLDVKTVLDKLRPVLEDEKIGKVGHNLKHDLIVMNRAGIALKGVRADTMVVAFLLDASRLQYGIDRLALDLLNFKKTPTSDLIGSGKKQISMDRVDLPTITRYAAEDADVCWRLYEKLRPKLAEIPELQKLHDEVELPLIDVLVGMEEAGIAVDPAILKEQSERLGKRIDALREEIHQCAQGPFNIDSPKQLGEVLFERLGLRSLKKTKTGFSTDVEVLERLAAEHNVPKLVLEYRSLTKLKGTYLDSLADHQNEFDGRIHTSFNQIGAATGRLSSSDPNLQNIPIRTDEGRAIRSAFVPGDRKNDVLLTADYSQIELRMLAHLSQEKAMMQAFEEKQDVHRTVAAEVFGVKPEEVTRQQRNQAKTVNFGIVYGVTAQGLARRIDGLDMKGAAELIAAYNKRFPRIQGFMAEQVQKARADGYVSTITGRRRPIFDINSAVFNQRNAAERAASNSVVQGSAADLIKIAMVNIARKIKAEHRPLKMLLQVHDELVFETPEKGVEEQAEFVRSEMVAAMTLTVPLEAEVGWGKNWQEVK